MRHVEIQGRVLRYHHCINVCGQLHAPIHFTTVGDILATTFEFLRNQNMQSAK